MLPHKYKNVFYLVNIRMINLSFDELRLIAQIRNISDYENKSKEDLIKALSEPNQKHQNQIQNQNQNHKHQNQNQNHKYQNQKHQK